MKKFLFPAVLTTVLLGVLACNNDEVIENIVPEDQKGLISFSASAVTGSASVSQPQTRAGFTGATQIIARMSSKKENDDAVRHTRTVLNADLDENANNGTNWDTYSRVNYATSNNRYWDDAFGRSANLSVYAVAVPGKADVTNNGQKLYNLVEPHTDTDNPVWNITDDSSLNTIEWQVSTAQTLDDIANEDLCYSHNIQAEQDAEGDLKYGKGKDGVKKWNGSGYNEYSYTEYPDNGDHYPTLDNGCMQFTLDDEQVQEGTGHFDQGHMIFHHALTRMTVKLLKGSGFGSDFTPNGITLLNMPYKGTLDFKNGTWSDSENSNIAMTLQSEANSYSYMAQFVPGYKLNMDSKMNVMQFGISGNIYYITQDMLYKALTADHNNTTTTDHNGNLLVNNIGNKIELEQGKNYVFTVTVNKQQIESITASLVPWIDVTAATTVKNDYVKINIEDANGKDACTYFDLYRLRDNLTEDPYAPETGPGTGTDWTKQYNWKGDYTEQATTSWDDANNVWKTQWFWESNKAFYHFRTVNQEIDLQATNTDADDYFNIFGGPIQDYDNTHTVIQKKAYSLLSEDERSKYYNDYHWGAPFKKPADGKKIVYNKDYGWSAANDADKQIYPAIGSTSDNINIIEHHMMSNVRFILKTTRDETATDNYKLGAGAVNLEDAEVTITRIYNKGKVYMGTGKVETVIDGGTESIKTIQPESTFLNSGDKTVTNAYTYRVVPQALYRGENKEAESTLENFVGLTIKTKDDNQYYVIKKLTTVTASTVQQSNNDYVDGEQKKDQPIEFWYPGHDYTYTITISKKGIEAITCSIVPWITVTGSNIDIDLEK